MFMHYLGFVSHGAFAQHRNLGSGFFLQTLDCVALRSQNLPDEIELREGDKAATISTEDRCSSKAAERRVRGPVEDLPALKWQEMIAGAP